MGHCYPAEDHAAALLERRWFAVQRAAAGAQAECEALAEQLLFARAAWQRARNRLFELESLRDALGEKLSGADDCAGSGGDAPLEAGDAPLEKSAA
jgi:hypothetical protein